MINKAYFTTNVNIVIDQLEDVAIAILAKWRSIFKNQNKYTKMSEQIVDSSVANFIQKSYEILRNNQYAKIIQWLPNGKQFAIKDIVQFEQTILPKYFRHRNINSFIRQLNMYGFHKSRKEPTKNIFSHPFFCRSHASLLPLVRRKNKMEDKSEENINNQSKIKADGLRQNKVPNMAEQYRVNENLQNRQLESLSAISFESHNFQIQKSPLKKLISKSYIYDINPELCLRMLGSTLNEEIRDDLDDDEILSIAGEIEKQRQTFQNRMSGVSILQTNNYISGLTDEDSI